MRRLLTDHNRYMVYGAVGLIMLVALAAIGIKASFGAYDGGYRIHGTFAAAGQGLLAGSDVDVRGVNVGEVASIRLVDTKAQITLRIDDGVQIPADAQAVIRPKTLFGEKFVDIVPGPTELDGPYLSDGGEITKTLGGFELEQVLTDAYPVLEAVDPAELTVVLDELAKAGRGLGPNINRSIVNASKLAALQVSNDAEVRQFLSDLALLSETIDQVSPDLVSTAQDLNVALPTLTQRSDQLNSALVQTARLSSDVADLLENNKAFTTDALTKGSQAMQVVYDRRNQIQPVLLGLQQYTQTLAQAVRIDVGDGTLMAAVKNLVSVQDALNGLQPPPPIDQGPGSILDGLPIPTLPLPGTTVPGDSSTSSNSTSDSNSLLDLLFPGADG